MTATTCRTHREVFSAGVTIGEATYSICVDGVTGDATSHIDRYTASVYDGSDLLWTTHTPAHDPAFAAQAAFGAAVDAWSERMEPSV